VLVDRLKALEYLLSRAKRGFLFFYFSTLDADCHVMWKHQDPDHPAYDEAVSPPYSGYIADRYVKVDSVIGQIRARLGPEDVLYVISDHGFTSFRREFNLATWLRENGYLEYESSIAARVSEFYEDVDWDRTRAYGCGFNGLYVNVRGREPRGSVEKADRLAVAREIRDKLQSLRDADGGNVFSRVYLREEIYEGPALERAPDLVVGYNSGYGPSDESVKAAFCERVLADNVSGFSGHHCVDCRLVPGVLLSTRRLPAGGARLVDVAPTMLREFGIFQPEQMTGRPLQ